MKELCTYSGPSAYVAQLVDDYLARAAEGKRHFEERMACHDIPGALEAHSIWLGSLQSADIMHMILFGFHLDKARYP